MDGAILAVHNCVDNWQPTLPSTFPVHDNKYMANKPETALYRALILSFLLASHGGIIVHDPHTVLQSLESSDHMRHTTVCDKSNLPSFINNKR